MKSNGYGGSFCAVYDRLNSDVDVTEWADFIQGCVKNYSDIKVNNVCSLACGTASLEIELTKRGYNITAVDLSEDMLCIAKAKSEKERVDIRFTHQDMSCFSLYSKADLFICMLDSVNYLDSKQKVSGMLSRVYDYLNDGGIFVFDVNSKYKFENIYADNAYILQDEGIFCGWENYYSKNTKKCYFYLSVFEKNADGTYNRYDEVQTEYMYTQKALTELCLNAGFEVCCICGDFDYTPANEKSDQRLYFILKKK